MNDYKRSYCGCEGEFVIDSCPYGYIDNKCSNPSIIKCCHEKCESSLDMVILMDSSGSIRKDNYLKGINFIKRLIDGLEISENETRVSLIKFSDDALMIKKLDDEYNKDQLNKIIDEKMSIYMNGETNTQEALILANEVLKEKNGMRSIEQGVAKVVVVITDGGSTINKNLTIPNAQIIKDRGFSIISVGIGSKLNQNELIGISSNKNEVYNADDYNKIFEIIEGLRRTMCQQPAKILVETPIKGKVSRNSYKYFRLTFDNKTIDLFNTSEENFSFSIALINKVGLSDLFLSFDEQNPKDPADFLSSSKINYNYIIKKKIGNYSQKIYQVNKRSSRNELFMSVKGFKEKNEFEIFIYNRSIQDSKINKFIISIQISFLILSILAISLNFLNH
jgi:hypothetical protein